MKAMMMNYGMTLVQHQTVIIAKTSDSNNCKNINSANTGDTDTVKAEDLDHKPLYENCPLTVGLSALLIITFGMRYLLSGKALHGLLELINDNMQTCPNALCHQDSTVTGNISFFIEVPTEQQLLSMFGTPGMWDLLSFHFKRIKKDHENLEDMRFRRVVCDLNLQLSQYLCHQC